MEISSLMGYKVIIPSLNVQGLCLGQNYTALPGDSWESVAAAKQTMCAAVRALNPGMAVAGAQLQAGDSVCLGAPCSPAPSVIHICGF